jgi:hypothetical protein
VQEPGFTMHRGLRAWGAAVALTAGIAACAEPVPTDGASGGDSGPIEESSSLSIPIASRSAQFVIPPPAEETPLLMSGPDFELSLSALMQFRYTASWAPDAPDPVDDPTLDFAFRRLRPAASFSGSGGKIRGFLQTEAASGEVDLLDAWISYQVSDHIRFRAGRFNLQYDRELIMPAAYLLAVDRSALSNTLNVDAANRVEGVEIRFHDDRQDLHLTFSEGLGVTGSAFNDTTSDWGATARYQGVLIGDSLRQFAQFTAPVGTPRAFMLGTAVHVQHLDGRGERFAATLDLTYQDSGFNAMMILGTQIAEDRNRAPFNEPEHDWGMVLKSGFYLTDRLEPYTRIELGTTSDDMHPDLSVLTAGFNYYIFGHALKFSTDFSVAFNGVGRAFDRAGDGLLLTPDGDNRYVWHAQIQMLF